jgi:hypothetical protein
MIFMSTIETSRTKVEILAELRFRYPWAKPADGKTSSHARAAANLRNELRRAFPGVKFRVTSKSFSMGDSVHVAWELGPTTEEVEVRACKYQDGRFDGMQDLYEDDNSAEGAAIDEILGRSKFVTCQRSFDSVEETVGRLLCRRLGVEYRGSMTQHVFGPHDGDYLAWHVRRILSKTSFRDSDVITGLEHDEENGGYRVTLT